MLAPDQRAALPRRFCDAWLLIRRIYDGDMNALDDLYRGHQPQLHRSVKVLLRKYGFHENLTEDVAQDVWIALLSDDWKRLKRYDPTRSSFSTYLKRLAKQLIQQRYRRKIRRSMSVTSLNGHDPFGSGGKDDLVQAELAEFVEHLTPQERRCLQENLMRRQTSSPEPPISRANEHVLKHRLQKKLRKYFDIP